MEDKVAQKTILHFIFINNENAKLNQIFKEIQFEVAKLCINLRDPKEQQDLIDNNSIDSNNKVSTTHKIIINSNGIPKG